MIVETKLGFENMRINLHDRNSDKIQTFGGEKNQRRIRKRNQTEDDMIGSFG